MRARPRDPGFPVPHPPARSARPGAHGAVCHFALHPLCIRVSTATSSAHRLGVPAGFQLGGAQRGDTEAASSTSGGATAPDVAQRTRQEATRGVAARAQPAPDVFLEKYVSVLCFYFPPSTVPRSPCRHSVVLRRPEFCLVWATDAS